MKIIHTSERVYNPNLEFQSVKVNGYDGGSVCHLNQLLIIGSTITHSMTLLKPSQIDDRRIWGNCGTESTSDENSVCIELRYFTQLEKSALGVTLAKVLSAFTPFKLNSAILYFKSRRDSESAMFIFNHQLYFSKACLILSGNENLVLRIGFQTINDNVLDPSSLSGEITNVLKARAISGLKVINPDNSDYKMLTVGDVEKAKNSLNTVSQIPEVNKNDFESGTFTSVF